MIPVDDDDRYWRGAERIIGKSIFIVKARREI